jgi:predicted RNase H-like HicB family nuclease
LKPAEEGGLTGYVPSLPGCVSDGNNGSEALQNIREAIELYLEPVDDDLAGARKEIRKSFCERLPSLSYDRIVKALQRAGLSGPLVPEWFWCCEKSGHFI